MTDEAGNVTAVIELDPWGGETDRCVNQRQQPYRYTTYERDGDGVDQALMRSYHGWWARFNEADPWEGSYDLTDPQSFNRYTYVQNDPVNFVDPSGLDLEFASSECAELFAIISRYAPTTIEEFAAWSPRCVRGVGGGGGEVGVGGGGAPVPVPRQNNAPQQNDCQRFADRVAEIASRHNDVRGFVDELAKTFIGVPSSDIDVMRQRANASTGEYFSSTGFKEGLFDDIADNQARHFIGGLIAGYKLGAMVGALVMNHNETSRADLRLNEISVPLGARLTNPSPARTVQVSRVRDYIKYERIPANPGFKLLADAIRNQVCAR